MTMNTSELVCDILSRLQEGTRIIVAIAGAPASGKSTFAEALAHDLGSAAVVLPMDGFHMDNRILIERGILPKKGAPETFDVAGFEALLLRLKAEEELLIPLFDRTQDMGIAAARSIKAHHKIILVEGNYLLLEQAPWDRLGAYWDLDVWLDVPIKTLQERLIQRWIDHGHTPEDARVRALGNDIPNAHLATTMSRAAQIVVRN